MIGWLLAAVAIVLVIADFGSSASAQAVMLPDATDDNAVPVSGSSVVLPETKGNVNTNKLSIAQIYQAAVNAGFQGIDAIRATAIALAESSGNANAIGDQNLAPTNGPSYGLWQINTAAHPDLNNNLFDPQANANAAFAVYTAAGNSFHPWSTFLNGAYLAHLDAVQNAPGVYA